jgi:hypothetical protein
MALTHAEGTQLLTDHRDQRDSLTRELLASETLDSADVCQPDRN